MSVAIASIEVRNFQSLKEVSVSLGSFTVIVGPSSSGKSAFLRACRLLASNSRGSAFVTHGAKTAVVSAAGEGWRVSLERGAVNQYRVLAEGSEQTYTKLGGAVPERVTQVLRVAPVPSSGTSVNFAGQFDRPYLLDDSGQQVARVLGELTNVRLIFDAAREANRFRLGVSGQVRTRKADLEDLQQQAASFADLRGQVSALESAEKLWAEVEAQERRRVRLSELVATLHVAESAVALLEQAAEAVPVPDLEALDSQYSRYSRLLQSASVLLRADTECRGCVSALDQASATEEGAFEEFASAMRSRGQCPLCGAVASSMQLEAVV